MHKHVALFLAFMIVGAALPLSVQAIYRYEGMNLRSAAGEEPLRVRRTVTPKDRADLRKALEIYNVLSQKGETGLVKPTINDPRTIRLYLETYPDGLRYEEKIVKDPISTDDYVAPVDTTPQREVSEVDRAEFRRAIKVRKCFVSLPTGMRELCEELIRGRKPRATTGLQNDLIKSRQQPAQ